MYVFYSKVVKCSWILVPSKEVYSSLVYRYIKVIEFIVTGGGGGGGGGCCCCCCC
jgi:hypothetical protein